MSILNPNTSSAQRIAEVSKQVEHAKFEAELKKAPAEWLYLFDLVQRLSSTVDTLNKSVEHFNSSVSDRLDTFEKIVNSRSDAIDSFSAFMAEEYEAKPAKEKMSFINRILKMFK